MIASLPELIAPLDEQDFVALLRSRASVHLQRGADPGRFLTLLDWNTLRGSIESGGIKPDEFIVTCNTHDVRPVFYLRDGAVDKARLGSLIERGASVVTNPIDHAFPRLRALCNDIRRRLGEPVQADAVMTSGTGGALKIHYDVPDIIVLQVEGSKRWRIYGPPFKNPVRGLPKGTPPEGGLLYDEVLHAGDLMIVPAGYWHHCENGSGVSLHVAVMIAPPTGFHVMQAILPRLRADALLRVPVSRFTDEGARAEHERAVKARLVDVIEHASFAELFAGALRDDQAD